MTSDELALLRAVIEANQSARPRSTTPIANVRLLALIRLAEAPHVANSAMSFLAYQTEAFAKVKAEHAAMLEVLQQIAGVLQSDYEDDPIGSGYWEYGDLQRACKEILSITRAAIARATKDQE